MSIAQLYDSPAAYFQDHTRISNSMLNLFRQSRRRYYETFIAKTMQPKQPTDAMVKGTLLHLLQLEPERWDEEFVRVPEVAPDGKKWLRRKGSDHEKWWAEFEAANEGKLKATDQMVIDARGMAAALNDSPSASGFLAQAVEFEQAITWQHEATGLQLKCRVDALCEVVILDIKSSSDPSPRGFARTAANLGYYRQAAHYVDGVAHQNGEVLLFAFLAVRSEAPYEVGVYDLDDAALELGRKENHDTLEQLAECYDTGDWRAPWEKKPTQISLPNYVTYNAEYNAQ